MKALLLVLLVAASAPALPHPAVERALDAVVVIDAVTNGGRKTCAGFMYTPQRVMTNAHCIFENSGVYLVKFRDLTATHGRLVGWSNKDDVAVLELVDGYRKPARLGRSGPMHPGDKVFAIGHPASHYWTVTSGVVSCLLKPGLGYGWDNFGVAVGLLQHDAGLWHGSSGGPLLNQWGEVVGINSGGYGGEKNFINWAVPIDHALKIAGTFQ